VNDDRLKTSLNGIALQNEITVNEVNFFGYCEKSD
jgi:hypothetical protein